MRDCRGRKRDARWERELKVAFRLDLPRVLELQVYERCSKFPTCVDACDYKARGRDSEKQLASLVRRDALYAFLRVCDEKTVFDETHTELP